MPTSTAESLSVLLTQHRPARLRDGYPDWLRAQVGAFVRHHRSRGGTLASLVEVLGVSNTTLATWSESADVREYGGFAPVLVEEPAPAVLSEAVTIDDDFGIDLLTPDGFRLQGLSFEQSLHAVRALR